MPVDFSELFADCYVLIKPSKLDDGNPKSRKTFECSADWFLRAMALLSMSTRTCEKCSKPRSEFATQTRKVASVAAPTQTGTMEKHSIAIMTEQTKTDRSISAVVASSCKATQTKVPVAILTKPEALIDCRSMAVKSELPKKHRQSLVSTTKAPEPCCKGTQTKPVLINAVQASGKLEAQNSCRSKPLRKNVRTQTERIKFRKTANGIPSSKSECNEKGVETLGAIGNPTHHVNSTQSKDKPSAVNTCPTATVKRLEKESTPKVDVKAVKRTGVIESAIKDEGNQRARKSSLGAAPKEQVNQRERKDAIITAINNKKNEAGRTLGSSSDGQTSQRERKDGIKHSSDQKQHQRKETNITSSNGNSCKPGSKENNCAPNTKKNQLKHKGVLENTSNVHSNQSSKVEQNQGKRKESIGNLPNGQRHPQTQNKEVINAVNVERNTQKQQNSTESIPNEKRNQPGHNNAIKNASKVEQITQERKNSIDSTSKGKQNQLGQNKEIKNAINVEKTPKERNDSGDKTPKQNQPAHNKAIKNDLSPSKNEKYNPQVNAISQVSDAALASCLQSVERNIRNLQVEQIVGCQRSQLPGSNPLQYVYAYAELLRMFVHRSTGSRDCLKELVKKGLWHVQRLLEDFNSFPPGEVILFDQQVLRLVRADGLWSFMGARRIVQDQHQNGLSPPVEELRSVVTYSSDFGNGAPVVDGASFKDEILQAVGSLIPVIKSIKRAHPEDGGCEEEVKTKRRKENLS